MQTSHIVLICTDMTAWLLVLLTIGAVARLTRLVTADRISEPIRTRLTNRWGDEAQRSYLITCDYCASMYVAPIVAWVAIYWPDNRVVILVLLALTASYVTGFIASKE